MPASRKLKDAARALHENRFDAAERLCRELVARNERDADAWHLLGLVRRSRGDYRDAVGCLGRSVELAPGNAEARSNFAQILLVFGRRDDARAEFITALGIAPGFRPARLGLARLCNELEAYHEAFTHALALVKENHRDAEAWSALGAALYGLGRAEESIAACREAIAIDPAYHAARANLITVLVKDERPEDALLELAKSGEIADHTPPMLRSEAAALMQLDRYQEAEAVLRELLQKSPGDRIALRMLTQARYVQGDDDYLAALRAAAQAQGPDSPLRLELADAMRRGGRHESAEAELRALIGVRGRQPELLGSLATLLHEIGRLQEARSLASEARNLNPGDIALTESLVALLLSLGEAEAALQLVEPMRLARPRDQRWITYRIDVARQRGEPLFQEWCDANLLVQAAMLPAPNGYAQLEDFLEELRAVIHPRHWLQREPLDQSLRHGTQSSRGLHRDPHPLVIKLLGLFADSVASYQSDLLRRGAPPPMAHLAGAELHISGCWSVRLRQGGSHVNHIHPEGTVSSAFYLTVPDEVKDQSRKSGWIKFGEPRWPMPGGDILRIEQPTAGKLLLFPSYLWHGTVPLAGTAPRVTIAFDATLGNSN